MRTTSHPTLAADAAAPRLTARQQQILDLVRRSIVRSGSPPTRAEIAAELGFRSANAAEEHLRALARKGAIELLSGTSRGIRLKADALRALRPGGSAAAATSPAAAANADEFVAMLSLPLVGRVAAGSPILAVEHIDRHHPVAASMFARRPDYLLRVRGMSMRDAGILDGDLLAVQRADDAKDGQIVVARVGDEVTVKRLHRGRGGSVELRAEHPDFAPIVVRAGEPFALEGLAVGLIRDAFSA